MSSVYFRSRPAATIATEYFSRDRNLKGPKRLVYEIMRPYVLPVVLERAVNRQTDLHDARAELLERSTKISIDGIGCSNSKPTHRLSLSKCGIESGPRTGYTITHLESVFTCSTGL